MHQCVPQRHDAVGESREHERLYIEYHRVNLPQHHKAEQDGAFAHGIDVPDAFNQRQGACDIIDDRLADVVDNELRPNINLRRPTDISARGAHGVRIPQRATVRSSILRNTTFSKRPLVLSQIFNNGPIPPAAKSTFLTAAPD